MHDIHFSICTNETATIISASGSGKTTFLSLPAGQDTLTEGTVKPDGIGGIFSLETDERALLRKEKLGIVFQFFQLLPLLTALENVILPLELQRASYAFSRARILLTRVGLSIRFNHYPKHLSGGEKQRVALA